MFSKKLSLLVKFCLLTIILSLSTQSAIAKKNKNKNNAPTALSNSYILNQNASLVVGLIGSDSDNDEIEYFIEEAPLYGELTGEIPNLIYKPNEDFFGEDFFTYKVNDSVDDSELATISFEVTQVNETGLNANQGNLAPECRNAYPSSSRVWPPNHKFTTIDILGLSDVEGDVTTEI